MSLKRFYKNNISSKEELRQESVDLICCQHAKSITKSIKQITKDVMKNEHEFSDHHEYLVSIITWNLAGNSPGMNMGFESMLQRKI